MRRIILAILLMSHAVGLVAQPGAVVPGELLVQLAAEASPAALVQQLNLAHPGLELQHGRLLSRRMGLHLLTYDTTQHAPALALRWLRGGSGVLIAQHNHRVDLRHSQSTQPNDPDFGVQWGLDNLGQSGGLIDADIDAPEAWDRSTGGVSALGDTLVVAVIDDGFDLFHEDLAYWRNRAEIPNNGLDDDNNGYIDDTQGWNAYFSNGNIPPANHGTEVAGVIGALGNNQRGGSGVNWYVQVMPVAGASGTEATVLEAYGYVLEQRRRYDATQGQSGALVVVTNSSFGVNNGDPAQYPLWCAMYDSLGAAGILNVAATMNVNTNVDLSGDVPSRCTSDYLIAVTNSTDQDQRNGGAAYGDVSIDLAAPGTSIFTTLPNDSYGYKTGTSFAAPFVAGAIALLYADACPAFALSYRNDPAAAALQMRQALLRGVDTLTTLSGLVATSGRLNAWRSLLALETICGALPSDCLSPYQLTAQALSDDSLSFTWSSVDTAASFRLRYRPEGSSTWADSVDLTDTTYQLSGLTGCTSYQWTVGTLCPDGSVVYAPALRIQTLGCCEAPTEVLLAALTDTSAALSWPPVFGATQYRLRYRPLSSPAWDSLTVDTPYAALSNLTLCTNYAWQIRSLCANPSAGYGPPRTFQTLGCGACLDLPYCSSRGQDVTYEWIERVQWGNLDQLSGSDGGYGAFTGVNYVLPVDTPLTLRLTPGFTGQPFDEAWRVWVDLNRDGQFDQTERLLDSGPTQGEVVQAITLPDSIEGGPTRIRVSMRFAGFDGTQRPNACGAFPNGEVEDYCVLLLPATEQPCPATAQVSADFLPGSDTLRVRWLDLATADSFEVAFRPLMGDSSFTRITRSTELKLGDLPPCTRYEVVIRARCGDILGSPSAPLTVRSRGCGPCRDFPYCPSRGHSDSLWIERFEFASIGNQSGPDDGYGDYTELGQVLQRGETYRISFYAGFFGDNRPVAWRVWVDWNQDGNFWFFDQWLAVTAQAADTVAGDVTLPVGVAGGSVRLRVSLRDGQAAGQCEFFDQGEVEDYCITLTPGVNVEAAPRQGIRLFPNPARDWLRVESDVPITSLRLLDLLGREVRRLPLDPGQSAWQIPLQDVAPGWYLIELYTSTGVAQRKIRVE